ncbi:FliM/FliN family flagellar motor switch protein [Pelagovum pacificum]|uniref:Flagellar motor switch protein FliM n=2 Tax=Pelagovum pacificum TaxID=2588711 RepID=A0A5C5GFR0_9RHOB|nr:FliM/FliN family flagellar motor switch protein [Pelagovum pacificum]TNY32809.1 flagellar motor switch protein FliM [Pelagovum pacificum]
MLARLARVGAAPPEGVVTPARALRLAFARAAEAVAGVKLAVTSVTEDTTVLDGLVAMLGQGDLLLPLHGASGVEGVAAIDPELRSAIVESQTTGFLSTAPAPERPVSIADAALARPVIDAFMVEAVISAAPTSLAGWTTGLRAGARLDGPRGAGLTLDEAGYRVVRLTVDLGVADRQGQVLFALPAERGRVAAKEASGDWGTRLEGAVRAAPAVLTAVLHRFDMTVSRAGSLEVGEVLPLDGVSVTSVRLEGPGQVVAAFGRLGQSGGLKAVRIEPPPPPTLSDGSPRSSVAALEALPDTPEGVPDLADPVVDLPGFAEPEDATASDADAMDFAAAMDWNAEGAD